MATPEIQKQFNNLSNEDVGELRQYFLNATFSAAQYIIESVRAGEEVEITPYSPTQLKRASTIYKIYVRSSSGYSRELWSFIRSLPVYVFLGFSFTKVKEGTGGSQRQGREKKLSDILDNVEDLNLKAAYILHNTATKHENDLFGEIHENTGEAEKFSEKLLRLVTRLDGNALDISDYAEKIGS